MSFSKIKKQDTVSIQLTNVKTGAQETISYSSSGMTITQGVQKKQEKQ